ncbi:MAG TPA: histidine kinase dimerization/phospho-acceptor domain-containing protein, partial [Thermoanaerobaculia bacterium]
MRRARLALILVPLLLSAALIGTVLATYLSVREVLATLVLGQGDAILDSLAHQPTERLDAGFLGSILEEQGPEGLRCIAVFDGAGRPRTVVGDCLAEGEDGLTRALFDTRAHEVVEVGGRVRMTRGAPSPEEARRAARRAGRDGREGRPGRRALLVEFEPVMRRELEAGALRSLGIGGAASLALVLVALGLWRFSLREERLKAAVERDRRLAALGEMAAVLAHEIRNPLASMKGHAQLLAERLAAGSPERGKADRVVDEARRLEELTSDLLSFVRSKQVERREVSPAEVLAAAARDVDGSRLELDVEAAPQTWSLDPHLMQQALCNLLRNALQASNDGDPAGA